MSGTFCLFGLTPSLQRCTTLFVLAAFCEFQFSSGLTNRPSVTDPSFVVQLPSLHPVAGLFSRRAAAPLLLCPIKRNEAKHAISSARSRRTNSLAGECIHMFFLQLPVSVMRTTRRRNWRKVQPRQAEAFIDFPKEEWVSQGRRHAALATLPLFQKRALRLLVPQGPVARCPNPFIGVIDTRTARQGFLRSPSKPHQWPPRETSLQAYTLVSCTEIAPAVTS